MITVQDIKRAFTTNLRENVIANYEYIKPEMVDSVVAKTSLYNSGIFSKKKNEVYLKALAEFFNEIERNGEVLISSKKETENSLFYDWDKRNLEDIRSSQKEMFLVGKPEDYKVSLMESFSKMKPLTTAQECLNFFAGKSIGFLYLEFDTNSILYSESVNNLVMKMQYINKEIGINKRIFDVSVRNLDNYIFSNLYKKDECREFFSSKEDYLSIEMFNLVIQNFDEYSENRKMKMPLVLERLLGEYLKKYEDPEEVDALDRALYKLQFRSYRYMNYLSGFVDRFSDKQKEYLLNQLLETTVAPINVINIDLVNQMYDKKGAKIFGVKFIEEKTDPDLVIVEFNALKELLFMLKYMQSNLVSKMSFEDFGDSIIIDNSYNNIIVKFKKSQYPNLTEENIVPFITETFNKLEMYEIKNSKRFGEEFNKLYRENALFKRLNEVERVNKDIKKKKI